METLARVFMHKHTLSAMIVCAMALLVLQVPQSESIVVNSLPNSIRVVGLCAVLIYIAHSAVIALGGQSSAFDNIVPRIVRFGFCLALAMHISVYFGDMVIALYSAHPLAPVSLAVSIAVVLLTWRIANPNRRDSIHTTTEDQCQNQEMNT